MKIKSIINKIHAIKLVLCGYKYNAAKQVIKSKSISDVNRKYRTDILKNWPVNGVYERVFSDLYSANSFLVHDGFRFPAFYVIITTSKGKKIIKNIENGKNAVITVEKLADIIDEKQELIIRSGQNEIGSKIYDIKAVDGKYSVNGKLSDRAEFEKFLKKLSADTLIYEKHESSEAVRELTGFEEPWMHIVFCRDSSGVMAGSGVYFAEHKQKGALKTFSSIHKEADIEGNEKLKAIADEIRGIPLKFQEVNYLNVAVTVTETGYVINQIDTGIDVLYNKVVDNNVLQCFRKHSSWQGFSFRNIGKYIFALIANKKGFVDYMYAYWLKDVYSDLKNNDCGLRKALWAHRRGFYSFRIEQYGLTESNYKSFLSDYEYKRMRPINSRYNRWLTDKMLTYYVLKPFRKYLPEYYCKVIPAENGFTVLPVDSLDESTLTFEYILNLLHEKKKIVCKQFVGSHGEGFNILRYHEEKGNYSINSAEVTEEQLYEFFCGLTSNCFISEFIEMHDQLKKIYAKTACTIRVMTINQGEEKGRIKHAYFRIATDNTGITDNVSAGGIVARINVETGEIYGAQLIKDHKFHECPTHVDTKTPISGYLPNWDLVKEEVENMCSYLNILEYLGFDVVITNDGFKILEINTHQDLHKYPEYPDDVKAFFGK